MSGHETAPLRRAGVRILLEFVPSISVSVETRDTVFRAFAAEGMKAEDFQRPAAELEAERGHPELNWARPHLRVHVVADMPVTAAIGAFGAAAARALAIVRRQASDLPIGLAFEAQDRALGLSFKRDDEADQIVLAMGRLPLPVKPKVTLLGWDRTKGDWIEL